MQLPKDSLPFPNPSSGPGHREALPQLMAAAVLGHLSSLRIC